MSKHLLPLLAIAAPSRACLITRQLMRQLAKYRKKLQVKEP